ncbi:MAG TPA: hypothetical protein VMV21_00860 [Vicinamibacteria bacterium]|nr:hypothetical protein [Vicinamibacteria bacterium]
MSASLSEVLLRVASAIAADGGASVRAALESVLREAAPFDVGEVVLVRGPGDPWRQAMGSGEGPLLGADLLAHVLAHGAAFRIDDWHDAEPFAETLEHLRRRSQRSLLTIPFHFEGGERPRLEGALAVARSHGWAFVGASLPLLGPLAAMAGLALDRALALTVLEERARPLEAPPLEVPPASEPVAPPPDASPSPDPAAVERERLGSLIEEAHRSLQERESERDRAREEAEGLRREAESAAAALREERGKHAELLRSREETEGLRHEAESAAAALREERGKDAELLRSREEAEGLRHEAEGAAAALREERGKNAELLSRVEATEARALAAEGSRDEWAQTAAALRTRGEEQESEMQSLRRGMAGARETAASAAELAEAGHARIRELQEHMVERDGRIRALEAELQGRENEARRLDEAAGRIAWLEQELRRGGESKEALEAERTHLAVRLEEAASTVTALEGDRRALAAARVESDGERARLVLETARLEAERDRLQSERDGLESEGNQARKDLEVALDRITALSVAPAPVTSDSGPVLDGPSPPKPRRGSRKARG